MSMHIKAYYEKSRILGWASIKASIVAFGYVVNIDCCDEAMEYEGCINISIFGKYTHIHIERGDISAEIIENAKLKTLIGSRDSVMTIKCGDEIVEIAPALIISRVLASRHESIIYWEDEGYIFPVDKLISEADSIYKAIGKRPWYQMSIPNILAGSDPRRREGFRATGGRVRPPEAQE